MTHRRTLSQWTAIDVAASVAIGAILDRTAVAHGQSFAVGATALVSILALRTVMTFARFRPTVTKLTDHRVRVLVEPGSLRHDQMRLCGVTDNDLVAQLRQQGVLRLADVRYVLIRDQGRDHRRA